MRKNVKVFLELAWKPRVLRTLQISPRVACYARTHIIMLHSEFGAVLLSLSDVRGKIILLINVHIERVPATLIKSCQSLCSPDHTPSPTAREGLVTFIDFLGQGSNTFPECLG